VSTRPSRFRHAFQRAKLRAVFNRGEGDPRPGRGQRPRVPLFGRGGRATIPLGKQADFHLPPAFGGVHARPVGGELHVSPGFPKLLHRRRLFAEPGIGPGSVSLSELAERGVGDAQAAELFEPLRRPFFCSRMGRRTAASPRPTVLTQEPAALKCNLVIRRSSSNVLLVTASRFASRESRLKKLP
jgi:hypothetical protein